MFARCVLCVAALVASVGAGCRRPPVDGATRADATPSTTASTSNEAGFVSAAGALEGAAVDAGAPRALTDPPGAGKSIDIPGGAFPSGSTPGDEGRDPTLEPALVDVSLTPFAIDVLPYPNDPAVPAKTGASLEEATRLCHARGARLCSELEWERACKGPDSDAFATGTHWNAACEKTSARCASGFGVRALGATSEMTDSHFVNTEGGDGAPVVRGGTRRCAARAKAGATGSETTFRCCTGPANPAKVPLPESRPGFKKASLEPAQLGKIFAQIPELARLGRDIRFFTEGDVRAITSRTDASHEGTSFMTSPVLWSPETGAELLVAAGRGKTMSFVVALWTLPADRYRFASALLMLSDLSPVVLAFEPSHRKELRWTSCLGCLGEQGTVSFRPDEHRVVIVQQ